ncbi:hypothetical protein [Pyxidicoccus xibeiensis]|uniref:hypothetical protein n=1 Tax=Pyxidicoccus xibeiensis TaxID=2906759 RepID=UPI0020A6E0AA|nr:hypothetical protein [Pyxidicoccus xibeiensis]MCP3137345.1 hypothetical protein [Pyxidicoccus xibeiensis]
MSVVRSGSSQSNSRARQLRLPLLLLTGLLSMGSGMGNPGCGTESGPGCEDGCYVEGTWDLTYPDTSPLPVECALGLPTGPLTITRAASSLIATADDRILKGQFTGRGDTTFYLWGRMETGSTLADSYSFTFDGELSQSPQSKQEPLTWKGTYSLYDSTSGNEGCKVERAFTATRR